MLNRVGVSSGGYDRYEREAKTPVTKGGRLNPGAVRQMSVGSIAGEFLLLVPSRHLYTSSFYTSTSSSHTHTNTPTPTSPTRR